MKTLNAVNPEATLALSIVVPVYNEAESLTMLYEKVTEAIQQTPKPYCEDYELVLVDDGSKDNSFDLCRDLHARDPRVKALQFRRNFGKTAALQAGFALSQGKYVFTIDADVQEDPRHIVEMIAKLDEGYDMVSGWRANRQDPLSKTLPSRVYNFVVSRFTGIPLHDFNCGFKAYRRNVIADLKFYGALHRFIPVLAHQRGFRVTEVPVTHRSRQYGVSKFGAKRLGRGYLDFIQVLFLTTYLRRPLRLFGSLGTLLGGIGSLILGYLTILWFLGKGPIGDRPLLLLGVLLVLTGVQLLSTGLIGEMLRELTFQPKDEFSVCEILDGEV